MGKRGIAPAGRPSDPGDAVFPQDHPLVVTFRDAQDELASTLVYLLGNRDDAMDALQESFLKCWRARDGVADVQNLRAWVFRVAMNTARDARRSAWSRRVKSVATDDLQIATQDAPAIEGLEEQEAVERLQLAIGGLRPEEKEVFLLRQNGELTYEQIAEMREVPVGTVKTQMRTALIKLRRVLNPADPSEVGP